MIQVGYSGIKTDGFLFSIPKNGSLKVKILVNSSGIISGDICTWKNFTWSYTGPQDPIHQLGGEPRWMAIVPVTARLGTEKKNLFLRLPKSAVDQLISLEGAGLRGKIFTISRLDGDGKSFVRYNVKDEKQVATVEETEKQVIDSVLAEIIQGTPEDIMKTIGLTKKHEEEVL